MKSFIKSSHIATAPLLQEVPGFVRSLPCIVLNVAAGESDVVLVLDDVVILEDDELQSGDKILFKVQPR